ncbi:MAG: glycosyltransferase family 39 protein [Candidatus Coatesbacteria bacterium]|nr:glycosyltransferase family 39 protein [Candidatus Coatesbacteria bacterium]
MNSESIEEKNGPVWLSLAKRRWPIILLLLMSGTLNFYHLSWGVPSISGSWAYDTLEAKGPLAMAYSISHGEFWFSRYPAGHHLMLLAVNGPYLLYLKLVGGLSELSLQFPYGFDNPERRLSTLLLINRAVSALTGMGIVLLIYLLGRRLFGELSGLIAAAAIALNVIFIYHSHTVNTDVPYVFWMLLMLHFFVRALDSGELRNFVLLSIFAAIALCTKESVYGVLTGTALSLLVAAFRGKSLRSLGTMGIIRTAFDRRHLIGLGIFILVVAIISCFASGVGYWFAKYDWVVDQMQVSRTVYPHSSSIDVIKISGILSDISEAFGYPLAILLFAGAIWTFLRYWRKSWPFLAPIICYYLVFQRNYWDAYRFSMPQMVFLALLGAPLIACLIRGGSRSGDGDNSAAIKLLQRAPLRAILRVAVAGVFGFTALHAATLPWLLENDSKYAAEAWLRQNTKPGETIEILFEMSCPRVPDWLTAFYPEYMEDRTPETAAKLVAARRSDYIVVPGGRLKPDEYPQDFGGIRAPIARRLMEKIVEWLESGSSGYERAAIFKTKPLLDIPVSHDTINPLIVIYRKKQ